MDDPGIMLRLSEACLADAAGVPAVNQTMMKHAKVQGALSTTRDAGRDSLDVAYSPVRLRIKWTSQLNGHW